MTNSEDDTHWAQISEAIRYCKHRVSKKYADRSVHILGLDDEAVQGPAKIINAAPCVSAIWAAISKAIRKSKERNLAFSFYLTSGARLCFICMSTNAT
jgi:hypothetical protein